MSRKSFIQVDDIQQVAHDAFVDEKVNRALSHFLLHRPNHQIK